MGLDPATITFLSDSSNGTNLFTSLANDVTHASGEARYNVENGVTANLLAELVSGPGDVVKEGPGELVFAGGNTGATSINAGTLKLSTGSDLNDLTSVTIGSGATFDIDINEIVGSISGDGDIQIASGGLSTDGDSSNTPFAGVISGQGALTKIGGTLF